MSNFLAVATVSATLRSVVDDAAQAALSGVLVDVQTERPDNIDPQEGEAAVSLFLYRVTPNPTWRNRDLPTRRRNGELARRPLAALDLDYLLTFFGDESQQQPQRMLGNVVSALEARPILTRERIRQVIAASDHLAGSDLDRQEDLVRLAPVDLNLEELSKLWSVFFQTAYRLSVAYRASVVLIEPEDTPHPSLPVARRNLYVDILRRPVIERVQVAEEPRRPIVLGASLELLGTELRGEHTRLSIGGEEIEPAAADVAPTRIRFDLAEPPFAAGSLRAGVRGVQVVHRRMMGTPETLHRGVESNVAAFVLRPSIPASPVDPAAPDIEQATEMVLGEDPGEGAPPPTIAVPILRVRVRPAVGADQRVVLLLSGAGGQHSLEARPRNADTDQVTFRIPGVAAGQYLVRIQVDGAESPLDADEGGGFTGPSFEVTA